MKRRARKKLHLKEFQMLGFQFSATYAERPGEELDALATKILEWLDEMDMSCSGTIGDVELDLFVIAGIVGSGVEEKRQAFIDFARTLPGLEKAAGENLIDAFYGPC